MRALFDRQETIMFDIFEDTMGFMGVICAAIFLAAFMKLWQQNKEEKTKKS